MNAHFIQCPVCDGEHIGYVPLCDDCGLHLDDARKYAARIKNSEKKRLAFDYIAYLLGDKKPAYSVYGISFMAKQAVIFAIHNILNGNV